MRRPFGPISACPSTLIAAAIEAVGEIDGIAGTDDDESAEDDEEPAEVEHHFLDEWDRKRGRGHVASKLDQRIASSERDQRFEPKAEAATEAGGGLLGDFQIVVIEADQPEAERDREHHPDVEVGGVRPQ